MNPIRDFLLDRRRAATPRLDALRAAFLSEIAVRPANSPSPTPLPRWWTVAWRELFLSSRNTWGALAAFAALALALNLVTAPRPPESRAARTPDRAALAEVARERQQLLAELSGLTPAPSPALPTEPQPSPPPAPPTRRSGLDRQSWMA